MSGGRAAVVALMGIDGCGKTTQARRLVDWLCGQGVDATYWRSEGGRSELDRLAHGLGRRDIADLVGPEPAAVAQAVIRWRSIRAASEPMSREGAVVVMDRYVHCQFAAARLQGLSVELTREIFNEFPAPDLALFLEIDPAVARERVMRRGLDTDSLELLTELDRAYRELPEFVDFVRVDAAATPNEVEGRLRDEVATLLPSITSVDG